MKVSSALILSCLMLFLLSPLSAVDHTTIFPDRARIRVQYQARRSATVSWTTYSTTLTDALSESMLVNQLLKRHPGYEVRVLSASADGRNVTASVRCQIRRGSSTSWSDMTTTVNNALTESMAENQIAARYSNAEVRILSMTFK